MSSIRSVLEEILLYESTLVVALSIQKFSLPQIKHCHAIFWTFYIPKIVTPSVLGSKVMDFPGSLYLAYTMKYGLQNLGKTTMPVYMLTDTKYLFHAITISNITT